MNQATIGIIALAWIATFGLLQFEHMRWRHADFRVRYLLGMGTVCLGCLGAGVALGDVILAIVPGLLATSGLTILLSYSNEEEVERGKAVAQKRGEVVGMAKKIRRALTQEYIDRGGMDDENDSFHSN